MINFVIIFFVILLLLILNNNKDLFYNSNKLFSVITLFKNYTPTFFTFQNFYKKVWGVKQFIYFLGYETEKDLLFIKNNYINKSGNKKSSKKLNINEEFINTVKMNINEDKEAEYIFITYKTKSFKNINTDWIQVKKNLYKYFFENIYNKSIKYISVDDDEFLYSNNIENIKKLDKYRFHFIEIIPKDNINNLEYSYQSWYSHNFDKKNKKYNCNSCKTYFFDINKSDNIKSFYEGLWKHSGDDNYKNSSCNFFIYNMVNKNKFKENHNKLLEKGICFHLTALTYKNLLETKLKNRYISNKTKQGNYVNSEKNINKVKKHYKTVIDNLLLKYIDKKDLKILRE